MYSTSLLLLAIVVTWWLLKAVFLPKKQVEDDAKWLGDHFGYSLPEDKEEAESHRVDFMPQRLLYAALAWLAWGVLYKAGL